MSLETKRREHKRGENKMRPYREGEGGVGIVGAPELIKRLASLLKVALAVDGDGLALKKENLG